MKKIEILAPAKIKNKLNRTSASVEPPTMQPDLMYMESVLVSTGENLNDDVFLPSEMWKARKTPAYKPVDWEHNTGRELTKEEQEKNPGKVVIDNQTIGVMYATYAIDKAGERIPDDATNVDEFHIIDEAVIWKGLYPSVAAKIEEGAKNNSLFVSMEAWFNDWDYLVGHRIVARNEETAFLDEKLRANGGAGVYENTRVRRILKNITFGGKGIVARPANEPSVITSVTHEPLSTKASIADVILKNTIGDICKTKASTEELNTMSAKTETQSQVISPEQYTKATEELGVLKVELEASKAKASETAKSLAALTQAAKQLDEIIPGFSSKISEGNPENFFSVLAESMKNDKKQAAEVQASLKAALDKIMKIEADAKQLAREAKLDVALSGMKDEAKKKAKKEKMMAALKALDDESFASLLETIAEPVVAEPVVAPAAPVVTPAPAAQASVQVSEEIKKMAGILGLSVEATVEALKEFENQKTDDAAELNSLLKNVAAEKSIPAGADIQNNGVDITQAYSGLVTTMLSSNKKK